MADSDEEDGSLDGVILQIFEEQADKFTFPLTTQKQTRDFVRLLNRKGFDYEMIADAVGEKLTYFQSWRLGSDTSSIGARVMKRINRPLQDAMLSDDDDKVVDKVKKLLFYGMSVDVDDAAGALDIIDDKRRKKIAQRDAENAKGKNSNKEEVSANPQKSTAEENKEVKNAAPVVEVNAIKDQNITTLQEKVKLDEVKSVEMPKSDAKKVAGEALNGLGIIESDDKKKLSQTSSKSESPKSELSKASPPISEPPKSESHKSETPKSEPLKSEPPKSEPHKPELPKSEPPKSETPKSEPQKSEPPKPTSSMCKSPDSLPVKPEQTLIPPSKSIPTSNNQTSALLPQASSTGHVGSTTEDAGVHQLKVSFGAKPHAPVASPTIGDPLEKATDLVLSANVKGSNPSIKTVEPISPKSISAPVLPKSAGDIINDKPMTKLEVAPSLKKEQTISPAVMKSPPSSSPDVGDSVKKQLSEVKKLADSKVLETKPTISWTDSVDSSTASESESSSSSSGISSSQRTKTCSPSSKSESKCIARILPVVPKQPASESETISNAFISAENYDSDLDWDEMNKLTSPTPQAKLTDSIRLFKKSVSEVDGPGFVYAMSDTSGSKPIATLEGMHRVKIGVSRFPLKRYEQAKAFNPDIKLLTSVPVRNRRSAVAQLHAELSSMTYRDTPGWYRGSIVKILQSLEDLEKS